MKHVLKMTLGTVLILAGLLFLSAAMFSGESIVELLSFSLIIMAIGALVIVKSYKPWKYWYGETRKGLNMLKENSYKAKIIKSVSIIGNDSKSNVGSAVGRAIVGDFVAGGVGSIVGASTAKKDGMTKFLVEFADGHKVVETVKDNSLRFQELIKYVKM